MVDFVIGRPQPESPEWAMEQQDLATPSTFGQAFGTGAAETTGAIGRFLQESLYEPEGIAAQIGRGMVATGELEGGVPPEQRIFGSDLGAAPLPDPVKRPAVEINEQAGAHITDQPMGSNLADLLITAKQKEIERENIWSRYANAHAWPTNLAVGAASFLADPLNAATLFVPGIGEEAILARLGVGLGGRIAAGAGSTALGATAAQLPLTALKYGIGREEASDYDLRSAFVDLAMNAAAGAVAGAGFGAVTHVLRARGLVSPEVPRANTVPGLADQASRVLGADAVTTHEATNAAVSEIVEGRSVDVEPFFPPPRRPEDIIDFFMRGGGIKDEGGELRAMDLNRPQQGKFGTLSRQSGMPLDKARELAEEEGFLPSGSDINDLLNAFRETSQGRPVFRPEEAPAWREYEAHRRAGEFEAGGIFDPNEMFGEITPANIVDHQRQLYRDGFAPGVPQSEIDAVRSALAEHEARPPVKPRGEGKPPDGWAAAGPEVVTGEQFRQRLAAVGGDLGKASDALVARVEAALGEGRSVTLYAEGKPIRIVSVDRGMMADAEGQRWGTMLLATGDPAGRTRIEIGPGAPTEAPGAPAAIAEPVEADPEIAAAEQRFAATQADHPLLPEEQAALDESRAAVETASLTEQALQEAANCLKESGI
jgi:hypothetical protein